MNDPNTYIYDWTEDKVTNDYLDQRDREDEPTPGMCRLCQCVAVDDVDSYCPECQMAEAEYREDR